MKNIAIDKLCVQRVCLRLPVSIDCIIHIWF